MRNSVTNWVFLLVAPLLVACETPNLKPWADATASLSAAVGVEHEAMVTRMTAARARISSWNSKSIRVGVIKGQIKTYKANAKQIETILDLAVDYSNALTQLAEAGEGGEKAAQDIMASLKKGAGLLDIAAPGSGAAVDIVGRAFVAVAAAYTRIEAQQTLAIAMAAAEEGNPNPSTIVIVDKNGTENTKKLPASTPGFVPVLAEQLTEMYKGGTPAGAQRIIIAGFEGQETGIDVDIAGLNRATFYKGLNVTVKMIGNVEATRLDHYFADLNNRIGRQNPTNGICWSVEGGVVDPNCITGEVAQSLDSVMSLVIATEQNYRDLAKARSENAKFARQRNASAGAIVKAVKIWRNEHKRIADELKRCGGWKAVTKFDCGNLTFSSFKAAIEKLQKIAGKGDN